MAASVPVLPITTIIIIIFFFFFSNLPNGIATASFSIDLIHRDSPKSPFYNSSERLSDRVLRAIRLSNSRINYFLSSTSSAILKDVSSIVLPNSGSYLMTISLGTPTVKMLAIADTGSDLIWTQCSPCESCFEQETPLFDPSKSSTYKELPCKSNTCSELPMFFCTNSGGCRYQYSYGDRSFTKGVLAAETLTMTSSGSGSINLPSITFGCGHNNLGEFENSGAGLVGLGAGPLSLVSQLGLSISKKFAYCLVPFYETTSSSRMDFGDSAVVSGNGTVYTPLIFKPGSKKSFYYVTLEKISVGDTVISLPTLLKGNIILDSGTTITYLPTSAYQNLLSALKGAIDLPPTKDPSDDIQPPLELCYNFTKDFKVPDLTFGFDGAEIVLGSLNTFIPVDDYVVCAAFLGWESSQSMAIIGNVAQQNFKIGFDLQSMKVAFKPTDCAHYQ